MWVPNQLWFVNSSEDTEEKLPIKTSSVWSWWFLTFSILRGKALKLSLGLEDGQEVFRCNEPGLEPFGCSVNTATARAGLWVIVKQVMVGDKRDAMKDEIK